MGIIRDFVQLNEINNPDHIDFVMVEFDNFKTVVGEINIVPIKRETTYFISSSSASNLSIIAANTRTAHKTQGSTFSSRVIVNLRTMRIVWFLFVSLSRVNEWENLFIIPFTYERYSKLDDTSYFGERASPLEII